MTSLNTHATLTHAYFLLLPPTLSHVCSVLASVSRLGYYFDIDFLGRVTSAFGLVCDGTSKVNSHPAPITYPAIHAMYNPKNGVNTGALLAHDGHIISQ